jgi:hypothetical protein
MHLGNGENTIVWSSADKFGAVLQVARMNEAKLAQYCRSEGLAAEQVAGWRAFCQTMQYRPNAAANCASKSKATAKRSSS